VGGLSIIRRICERIQILDTETWKENSSSRRHQIAMHLTSINIRLAIVSHREPANFDSTTT